MHETIRWTVGLLLLASLPLSAGESTYAHELTAVTDPRPILAGQPKYVAPVDEKLRLRAPLLINDDDATLTVESWRFSYNARGIIEVPNRLAGKKTAVVIVHPWGIDDGQGWITPEPAGVAFACTPEKNALMLDHGRDILNPLLKRLRPHVGLVVYSLPGLPDPARSKMYRDIHHQPTDEDRQQGAAELKRVLTSFTYKAEDLPKEIPLTTGRPVIDYFKTLPGLDAYERMTPKGYWNLPIPVMKPIEVERADVVIYDKQGYPALRDFLVANNIEHILLGGYHADMCVCSTTAGYENLRQDFNTFLVGDAVQASLPGNQTAAHSTNHAVTSASLKVLVTESGWIDILQDATAASHTP